MAHLRTDAMLLEILAEQKTIDNFLNTVFDFLHRNTYFYHTKNDINDKIGFTAGEREQMVVDAMQRYVPKNSQLNENLAATECLDDLFLVPAAEEEIEVETVVPDTAADEIEVEKIVPDVAAEQIRAKTFVPEPAAVKKALLQKSPSEFTPGDYTNGAAFDSYCWAQSLKDVDVQVKLPQGQRSAKQLSIEIKADSISVKSRQKPNDVLFSGQLSEKYKHHDAVWTINGDRLQISFDKTRDTWWKRVFVSEPEIDTKKLVHERFMDELPEGSQLAINKLKQDQMSQQSENEEESVRNQELMQKLKEAWNNDDSPFKGQPFDPNTIKFN